MKGASLKRREFITLIGGAAAGAWPLLARAQQPDRVRRVGVLATGSFSTQNIFDMAMRELGWRPGQDVQIDFR